MTPELQTKAEHTIAHHERMAAHWASKASLAQHAGNEDDVQKCERQRQSHLDAADTVRTLLKLATAKAKPFRGFVPPTLIEAIAFSKEHEDIKGRWPVADIKAWFNHFESNGWKVGGKTPMKNWKAAALNGYRNWQRDNPGKAAASTPAQSDPEGWPEFLRKQRLDWVAFKYAPNHVRTEFAKQRPAA